MTFSRRVFVARTAALAALGDSQVISNANPAPASNKEKIVLPAATLHGYGALSATVQMLDNGNASITHILCESVQKARLVQAKYLSDMKCLPGSVVSTTIRTQSGACLACCAQGRDVWIVAATNQVRLSSLCRSALPPTVTPADFKARASIPMYLDRWDRYGLLCYFGPNALPPDVSESSQTYDYADALTFVQSHGPLGLVVWTNPLVDDYSEGLNNEQSWGWMQANARKRGLPVHINTQFSYPQVWMANRYREQTMLNSPQFLGGYYGVGHDSAGVGAISWLSQEAEDVLLGTFQQTVRRFAKDPNIVGWLEPHGETYELPQKYFLDSGPYADEVWRNYLRGRYKTLSAVSERWHGRADHYKSWEEIHTPEVAEFAGFGPDAIDLRGIWRVRYLPAPDGHTYTVGEARDLPSPPPTAPVPPEWYRPGCDDSGWDELLAPGNDRMLYMARSPLLYRRTLEIPAEWLNGAQQITLTLWDMVNRQQDVTLVAINGQFVKEQSYHANDQHWSQFDVTGALKPGANLLVLQMPRAILCYRAYLSKSVMEPPVATQPPPQAGGGGSILSPPQYPRLGRNLNARWVDFVEWNVQSRGAQIRRGAEMIRQVDPHSSINFMAAGDYVDPVKRACQDYGGRFHDTGSMAGFWTEENTLMMTGVGLPTTAEAGNGAPNAREFQLFWGRWLTEGLNGIHYFQNWGEIAWNPEVLKVFEANLPMYTAVGKYHSPFAHVGVLFSSPSAWLTSFPWRQEPGMQGGYYSIFNAATQLLNYCPRDGVGVEDFGVQDSGIVRKYRAIIDSNSIFMDEKLIDGIERYVRQGGVFITYGQTGRHTPIEPDSWPLAKLTGYAVERIVGWGDGKSVSLAPNQMVFAPTDLPPQTRVAGLSLKPTAADCRALAVWEDGTVAIGMRPHGAGWVVQMGLEVRDERFMALVGGLLRHFGVTDRVPATVRPQRGLHMRHFIGNTGLHDVWILFNESDVPLTTDLNFLPGVHPPVLIDIVTGQKLEVVRDPGGDRVAGIELARWQSRLLLSPRTAQQSVASPHEWLTLQRAWWQGTVKPPNKRLPSPAEMQRFSVDLTEGWAYKSIAGSTDAQAEALMQPEVDDRTWERRQLDLWLAPGDKSPKRHLLRRRFTVPKQWTAGQIVLCADIPGAQFSYETRLFIDGKGWANGRKTIDGPYFDALDGALTPGSTHLLALDIQGRSTLTGSHGPIWLYYLPDAPAHQDLAGTWTAYADPLRKLGDVQLPGTVHGMIFSRNLVIDSSHKGRNVVIYYEATGDRFSLLINGQLMKRSEQVREQISVFNITPLVHFDAENRIELLGGNGTNEKSIRRVEIRFYEKGMYP